MKIAALTVLAALTAVPAGAQTYNPAQSQQRLNQFQLQMQSDQLQQLQRQNAAALPQPDPAAQMQAVQRQQSIQQQIDETNALRQQMQAPQADPGNVNTRLQADGARIQQLQQAPPILPGG
jgi:hypothetical protein